jgi:hypothetical protein
LQKAAGIGTQPEDLGPETLEVKARTTLFSMENESNNVNKLFDDSLASTITHHDNQLGARKVYIAFWDKLVLLEGGTLALSLSAATAFRGHTVGDGGVGYLSSAWKFLLASIIVAVIAQWIAALSWLTLSRYFFYGTLELRLTRLSPEEKQQLNSGAEGRLAKRAKDMRQLDNYLWVTANLCGALSVLLLVIGFLRLVHFGEVNVASFLKPG